MKLRTIALAAALLVSGALRANAQATLQGDLLKDWTNQKEQLVKITDAMPDDKFSFKATPAQRSFAEHGLHAAGAIVNIVKMVGTKAPAPTIDQKVTAKADVLKALNEAYDYALAAIKEQTQETLLQQIDGPRFMGPSTRARLLYYTLAHSMDSYGQLAVYLRLNGIVPPASRGM